MIHANIVEAPMPDPSLDRPDETFDRCVRQLNTADRDYFGRRAAQEARAANASSCCEARIAHEELAAAYRFLCSSSEDSTDHHLAFDLAMFQFNPKPVD